MHSPVVVGTAVLAASAAVTFYGTTRAQGSDGAGTLRFYEHDTQQANIDHGDSGASTEGVFDQKAVFSRGETVAFTVTGGTGLYRGARGEGTVQVPVDVPNQTDANFVLHLSRGD